ncbi:hypothetical protein IWW34DRAFT_873158 [Fusarium oxysporum f. sp. albedinis]|nr:hypothetical protein IWW34DRAFT_873158 [Fusarium oxysporum f. sp. albedinis]KAJ0128912.1 Uncharacterized protein HZ326_27999 [Fusarium oxysporum f. sp. albedinis]KAK2470285.1 hypothetical protein H9L39_17902 [Fusarium oxysporum f. sp. albedinis]
MSNIQAWQYSNAQGGLESALSLNKSASAPTSASLSKGQILVKVIAAAVNPADYKLPEIGIISKIFITKPATPGLDFCGRVVATHHSVTELQQGQLVYGALSPLSKHGTLCQFIIAPVSECVLLPDGVDPCEAAAVGTAGLTAYQALLAGKTSQGSKVLINGGSGGTGTFGIQLAKLLGSHVTTTCSTANVDLCRRLGADTVLDYKQVDLISELEKSDDRFDIVVDNVGTPGLYETSPRFMKPNGVFLQVHFNPTAIRRSLLPKFLGGGSRQHRIVGLKTKTEDLEQLGRWVQEGKLKPVIETYDWKDVPKAYTKLKSGRTVGKLVIRVPDS